MNPESRYEYKYQLSQTLYRSVRNALTGFMRLDGYSLRGKKNRYLVRSLYYDTDDLRAVYEKVHGERNRIKARIRTYTDLWDNAEFASIELKTKFGSQTRKFATRTSMDMLKHYLKTGGWPRKEDPVLEEFERYVRLNHLRPKVLVDYEREAFVPLIESDTRVTFDHLVRFANSSELFPSNAHFRSLERHQVILEIKVREDQPNWLQGIVKKLSLSSAPNSKYVDGIRQTRHDVTFMR